MNDTATFGSFTTVFLTKFRDEFVKLPCISFSALSEFDPGQLEVDDVRDRDDPNQ